tara:strand:- start:317 stop:2230 length:1914 start_codon:yes stop_codon:yes gene_type:complete
MTKQHVIANKVKQSYKLKLKLNRFLRHSFLTPRNDVFKKVLLLFTLFFSISSFSQAQKTKYKTYSYSQLFKMIEAEKDSIFKLSDAKIVFNAKTDSIFLLKGNSNNLSEWKPARTDSIHVNKLLEFTNIDFSLFQLRSSASLGLIQFHKGILFENCTNINIFQCTFHQGLRIINRKEKLIENNINYIIQSDILGDLNLYLNSETDNKTLLMYYNYIRNDRSSITQSGKGNLIIGNNEFNSKNVNISNYSQEATPETVNYEIMNNKFEISEALFLTINTKNLEYLKVANNSFNSPIFLEIDNLSSNSSWIVWEQFENKVIDAEIYFYWLGGGESLNFDLKGFEPDQERYSKRNIAHYLNTVMVQDRDVYNAELSIKGKFYNYYNQRHEMESSNAVYREIKDLETKRLAFLYEETPSFDTFFTWKINQFLKVFSGYGTKPAKAVIFSMYVILLFAFIYLLFPNSWDAHGRKRIMNRYAFFFKYMNKKAGIHEVYLDNQKEELLEFDEFKTLVEKQGKTVPKFFTATALPLYKWAISGTKFSATILKRVDIMKGTWSELPQSKRIWKSVLLISAFTIAICYDILIKMLNALMLSINTFTTLGFGEIPIKGLPRYLAIIQGFIGWFMLTIFSVSLISQLLN